MKKKISGKTIMPTKLVRISESLFDDLIHLMGRHLTENKKRISLNGMIAITVNCFKEKELKKQKKVTKSVPVVRGKLDKKQVPVHEPMKLFSLKHGKYFHELKKRK